MYSWLFEYTSPTPYIGAFHASDLGYTFAEASTVIGDRVRAGWIAFAVSLDPNAIGNFTAGVTGWPLYGDRSTEYNMTGTQMYWGNYLGSSVYGVLLDDYRVNGTDIWVENMAQFMY